MYVEILFLLVLPLSVGNAYLGFSVIFCWRLYPCKLCLETSTGGNSSHTVFVLFISSEFCLQFGGIPLPPLLSVSVNHKEKYILWGGIQTTE